MSMFPPAVFVVEVMATEAIAKFEAINAQLGIMQKQALAAGASIGTLEKSLMMGKAAFMAAAVAAAAFGTYAVKASMENEESAARLNQTLQNMGLYSAQTEKSINDLANSMTNLGFSDNEAMDSMATLITATGSVADSTHLLNTAMDLARYKHMSLQDATSVIARGTQGAAKAFKEMGITLDTTLPKQEAINKAFTQLQEKIGGQATAAADTLTGKLKILGAKFELMAESVGNVLIPIFSKMIDVVYFIGKSIGAIVGPIINWVERYKTILTSLTIAVLAGIAAYKAYVVVLALQQAALKLYVAWQIAASAAATTFQGVMARVNATLAFNPLMVWVVALTALAAGFVYAWNHSETFRKVVVEGMKGIVMAIGYLIKAFGWVAESILKVVTGPMKLMLTGLAALGIGPAKSALKMLNSGIESVGTFFDKTGNKVQDFADKLDGLKDKKIPIPKFNLGAPKVPNTKIDDPFNLTNYTGAGDKADEIKDKLAPLLKDVEGIYSDMNGVIADYTEKKLEYEAAAAEREASAQKQYADALFNINRDYNESLYKLDRDFQDRKDKINRDYEEKIFKLKRDYNDKKFTLQRSYNDKIADLEKAYSDSREVAERKNAESIFKIQEDYQNKVTDLMKAADDKRKSIIAKSAALLTDAFANATRANVGSIFASLLPKDNALANSLFKQVKDGVSTVVSWWGTAKEQGIGGVVNDLKAKIMGAQNLAKNAAELAARGFSQTFIQEVISQGPDVGNQMAAAILNATPEAAAELQSLYSQMQTISETGVTELGNKLSTGTSLATKQLTDEYAKVNDDLQAALIEANAQMQSAMADQRKSFLQELADMLKSLNDGKSDAGRSLSEGLADAQKTFEDALADADQALADSLADNLKNYNDSLEDLNLKLKDALADADKALKDAIKASQDQFNKDIDKLQKDSIKKLGELQTKLAEVAAEIRAVAGASAAVSITAGSPAAPYLAGTSTFSGGSSGVNTNTIDGINKASGFNITQNITMPNANPAPIIDATISAIKFGTVGSVGQRYAASLVGM